LSCSCEIFYFWRVNSFKSHFLSYFHFIINHYFSYIYESFILSLICQLVWEQKLWG
jgi:hypothetical protein